MLKIYYSQRMNKGGAKVEEVDREVKRIMGVELREEGWARECILEQIMISGEVSRVLEFIQYYRHYNSSYILKHLENTSWTN